MLLHTAELCGSLLDIERTTDFFFFGSDVPLSFSPLVDIKGFLYFIEAPFIRPANEKGSRLTHWHFIVGHDDYISSLCTCWAHKANWMAVFSSCGQSPAWPCISAYAHSRVTGWGHDLSAFVYEKQTAQACKITYFMQLVVCCTALQFLCNRSKQHRCKCGFFSALCICPFLKICNNKVFEQTVGLLW